VVVIEKTCSKTMILFKGKFGIDTHYLKKIFACDALEIPYQNSNFFWGDGGGDHCPPSSPKKKKALVKG